jgi:signal transduction histidine kinase
MHLIHDLRIVLFVLAGYLETLRKNPHAEPLTRELDGVGRLLEAGLAMADDLLVSPELKPAVAPVDAHDVIGSACDVIQSIVGPNVRVETMLTKGESRVYARQVDLDRILLNIVCNAAAAMKSGGVMVIETAHIAPGPVDAAGYPDAPFGRLRLTITDTGSGVPIRDVWQVGVADPAPPWRRPPARGPGRRRHHGRDHAAAHASRQRTRPLIARSRPWRESGVS